MRESFIFYKSFYEALEGMDKESQADCLMALARYALTGETGEMKPVVKMFLMMAKPQIDANNKRFENGCKGGEFGKLGGRPRKTPIEEKEENENPKITPKKPLKNPTETPNVNDNVNVNEYKENNNLAVITKESENQKPQEEQIDLEEWLKEHDTSSAPKKFKKPTLVEVKTYMNDSGYAVSPERFIAYYDSIGWKVGKNPMKDWKAALRGWAIRERAREKTIQAAKCLYPGVGGTYGEGVPL